MSYGLKYQISSFRDSTVIGNNLWRINIYSNGYGGSVTAVSGTDSVINISYKKQDITAAINGSECTLGLYATTTGQYDEFLTAAPLQYWLQVYKSTDGGTTWNVYWQGVNTTDTVSETYVSAPYQVSLKFNCGLGELQWHRYENSGALFDSYEQVIQVLNNCFSFLPYSLNIREIINVREDTMTDSSGLLQQLYIDDQAFYENGPDQLVHGIPCMKIIQMICTGLNCRVYQSNNMWFVERIYERTKTSVKYFDYTTGSITTANTMAYSATGTLAWTRTISNSTYPKLLGSSEKGVTTKNPITVFTLDTSAYNNDELIPNPFFEDVPSAKDAGGRPLRWDRSSAIQSVGGDGITLVSPYESDPRYRWAYTFGATNIADNINNLNSNTGWYNGSPNYYSQYTIHSVLRSGDTYTKPWLYTDTTNGSFSVNIQLYFEVTLYPQNGWKTSVNSTLGPILATSIMNAISFDSYIKLGLYSGSGNYFINSWTNPAPVLVPPSLAGGIEWFKDTFNLGDLCTGCYYPNDGLQQQALNAGGLAHLMYVNANGSFKLKFRTSRSFNVPLSSLPSNIYSFDCVCAAPYYDKNALSVSELGTNCYATFALTNYGINAIDVQYKDSYQSATPYETFYATSDSDSRWNALTITSQLGDSLTPGYPGSWRVSSGAQTGTWHNVGLGDTGQILADILFKNFAQIPANYRSNIKGHIFDNTLQYFHSVVDETGIVYMQMEHDFDIKACAYQTDMFGMADDALVINTTRGTGTIPVSPSNPVHTWHQIPLPIHAVPTTPVAKGNAVHAIAYINYPTFP